MLRTAYKIVEVIHENKIDDLKSFLDKHECTEVFYDAIYSIPTKTDNQEMIPFSGLTLLHVAAYYDATECLEFLLAHPSFSDVDKMSENSFTPLHYAILGSACECTLLLLTNGANPNVIPQNTPFSPLFLAAQVGNISIINMLFDFDAMHVVKDENQSPVKEALRCRNFECFELLLEKGFNSKSQNKDFTPLMTAISNGLDEAVPILLRKGHNPNYVSKNGLTALSLACQTKNEHIVKILLSESIISLDTSGVGGTKVIHWAASTCNMSIIKMVVEYGASIEAKTKRGESALAYVLRTRPRPESDTVNHRKDINDIIASLKFFISKGLTFNEVLNDGSCTALEYMMDTSKADTEVIEYIFSTGLDLDLKIRNATLGDFLYKLRFGKLRNYIIEKLQSLGYQP